VSKPLQVGKTSSQIVSNITRDRTLTSKPSGRITWTIWKAQETIRMARNSGREDDIDATFVALIL
jgi:hypothetical protein